MPEVINKIETGDESGQLGEILNAKQFEEALIKRLLPRLVAYKEAQKTVLKDNDGTRAYWLGFEDLADDDDGELVEGVTPDAVGLKPFETSAEVKQYGKVVKFTDRLLKRSKYSKLQAEALDQLTTWAEKVIDRLIYKTLKNQTLKIYGGNGTTVTPTLSGKLKDNTAAIALAAGTLAATSYYTEDDFEKAYVWLSELGAPTFDDGYYHCQLSPKAASDVRKFPKFVDKSKYQDPTGAGLLKNEIGVLKNIKFIECPKLASDKIGDITCENAFVYGKDAYGVTDVEENRGKPEHISKGLGQAGDDQLNQRASEGVKWEMASKVLCNPDATVADPKDQRVVRIVAPASITV